MLSLGRSTDGEMFLFLLCTLYFWSIPLLSMPTAWQTLSMHAWVCWHTIHQLSNHCSEASRSCPQIVPLFQIKPLIQPGEIFIICLVCSIIHFLMPVTKPMLNLTISIPSWLFFYPIFIFHRTSLTFPICSWIVVLAALKYCNFSFSLDF